jgi:uncharacterized membrane protein
LGAPFWLDESAQVLESSRPLIEQFQIDQDFQPPLLHLYLHFLLIFNQSEFCLRLFSSVLFSLIGLFYFYQLIKDKFNKKVAYLTLFFLSISSFLVYFSQELRQYSLTFGLVMMTWYLVDNRKINLTWWTVFSALGLLSSYLYVVVFLSQLFFLILNRKIKPLQLIKQLVFLGFLTAWWLYFFLRQFRVGQALRGEMIGWDQVVSFSFIKGLSLTFGKFFYGIINLDLNFFFISFSSLILIVFLLGFFQIFKNKNQKDYSLLTNFFYWLYLPFLISISINFIIPVLQPKRVVFLMPFLILNFFWFCFSLINLNKLTEVFVTNLIICLFFVNFYSLFLYSTDLDYQRENWLKAMTDVENKFGLETALISVFKGHFSPLVWYNKKVALPLVSVQSFSVSDENLGKEFLNEVQTYQKIALIDYLADLTDPARKTKQFLLDNDYQEIEILSYPLIGQIFILERNNQKLYLK